MRNTTLIILFVSLFISGCKTENDIGSIKRIEVDLDKVEIEDIQDVFVYSDTVFLETTSESLIKSVTRLSFAGDEIFIWDSPNKLLAFSKTGAFLGNIGTKGRAGNEYIAINDYFIRNDTVFIYDFNNNKLLSYKTSGAHLENTPIELSFDRICPLPDNEGYIVLNTFSNREDNPKFSWLNRNFEMEHSSREQRLHGTAFSNTFSQNGGLLSYWEIFNDTLYSVTKDRVAPEYVVDFMGYAIPPDIVNDIPKMTEYYMQNSSRVAGIINNVIVTDEIVAFMFAHDMASHWALVDKKSNHVRIFRLAEVNESLGKLNYIATYHDGWFYGVYMPNELNVTNNSALIRFRISIP